jgi:hypothetical protein
LRSYVFISVMNDWDTMLTWDIILSLRRCVY